MSRFLEKMQGMTQGEILRDGDDIGARDHGVLHAQIMKTENVLEQCALMRRNVSCGFFKRIFNIFTHRGWRKTKKAAQAIKKAIARIFIHAFEIVVIISSVCHD